MATVVNEPHVEYNTTKWKSELRYSIDESIKSVENETISVYAPSKLIFLIFPEKPKRKLSALRGKMSKQIEKEIDKQISNLRNEWDRNI